MIPRAHAAIIAVGDELLLGRTVDTNSAHIARWCADHGVMVRQCQIMGDDEEALAAAIASCAAKYDLVLITGGLGPTLDDRTRHALACAAAKPLVEQAAAWKAIQAYYARVRPGQAVPMSNRRQALLPRGARMLSNDRGTAPGMLCKVDRAWVACLPGVPVEMYAMLDRLAPRLPRLVPQARVPTVNEIHIAGVGESAVQDILGDLLAGNAQVDVGITAHELGHITVRVVGAQGPVQRRLAALRRLLKPYLLPAPGLAVSVVEHLRRHALTITAAESCTCGHIVAAIGAVPGASAVLEESMVAYHERIKRCRIGVSDRLLAAEGVVSQACAEAMAEGMRLRTGASIALASTGIAGPGGGSRDCPVGSVWIAVASAAGVHARLLHLTGNRERIQRRAASAALLLAWQGLQGGIPDPR